jgi:hypothetical protein
MNPGPAEKPVGASPHAPGVWRFTGYRLPKRTTAKTARAANKKAGPTKARPNRTAACAGARGALQRSPILRPGEANIPHPKQQPRGHFQRVQQGDISKEL